MINDGEAYEPGTLVGYEERNGFSLVFSVGSSAVERADVVFEEMDYWATGYAWDAVVAALVSMRAPDLASKLHYNSEGSLFCVESADPEVLKHVAQLIRNALEDEEMLKEAITHADPALLSNYPC